MVVDTLYYRIKRRHFLILQIFIGSIFIVQYSPNNLFLVPSPWPCERFSCLQLNWACSVPVPLDYHSIPLTLGKEIDTYKVNMAGMGHRSVRLSTSKWAKYVKITSVDWSKTLRYVGSKIELRRN